MLLPLAIAERSTCRQAHNLLQWRGRNHQQHTSWPCGLVLDIVPSFSHGIAGA